MEDDLIFWVNGRRPHFFVNGRGTQSFGMEDDLNILVNRRQPQFHFNGRQPQKNNAT
jgi:hypothetical protein